ncbi:glycosyltransferase [Synechococcus sp. BA-132 BA5]|uniref:glycosyltransferase n=1 Tax=Synechococcus sp. BA-132 BA5 TaxID=3110252 RepID=UPI002B2074DD|nr:glycosyltransferase [Synechococcus sp. BA-132 BA5]MEA5413977.1 glycosyltransferase [Synechococcus sp. BA-132 BA5]
MSNSPFFSIITVSFNQATFLPKCLASVSSQGFKSCQHIVVDPGSHDGSRELILGFQSDLILPVFQKDSCAPEGLNHGLAKVAGVYTLFVNSDDYLVDGALDLVYARLVQSGFPDILFMGGYIEDLNAGSRRRFFPGSIHGKIHAFGLSQIFQQGSVVKSDIVRRAKGFNTSNRTCWDGELFLQLLADPDVYASRSPDPVAVFVIHPGSITGSGRGKGQYLLDSARIVKTYYGPRAYSFRVFLSRFPRVFRLVLKYMLDLRLALWRFTSLRFRR